MDTKLIELLNQLKKERVPHATTELAAELDVDPDIIPNFINNLLEYGYAISRVPHCGYRLEEELDVPYAHEVQPLLSTKTFGRSYRFLPLVDSTNLYALNWLKRQAPNGACVVADAQTRGRGRSERPWQSPPGKNIYLSLIYKVSHLSPVVLPQVSLVVGIALAETVNETFTSLHAQLKWPNDVMLERRKLAGILCEISSFSENDSAIIIGVGINVNLRIESLHPEIAGRAISITEAIDRKASRPQFLAAFLNHLEPYVLRWEKQGLAPYRKAWEQLDFLKNKQIRLRHRKDLFSGTACGITDSGELLLKAPDNRLHRINSGEVHLLDY